MRLLWVKSGSLVPLDTGGKIRSFNLLKELARRHEVILFTFYAEQPDDTHASLAQHFHRVIALPFPIPEAGSAGDYFNYVRNLFSVRPYSMSKYCKPWVAAKLREHLRDHTYDVIVPYVWQSAVYVVPLRIGGGTRIKIFEALGMDKAVVSTTIGAEGLPVTHGEHLILADTPADFAQETVRLMRNPTARARLGSNARTLLEQHYGWAAVAEDFSRVLGLTVESYAARRHSSFPDPVPARP